MEVLKVSKTSDVGKVAGAIAAFIREDGCVEMQCVGAAAINQAVKAIATARGFTAPTGVDLISIPSFKEIVISGEVRTAIRIVVEKR